MYNTITELFTHVRENLSASPFYESKSTPLTDITITLLRWIFFGPINLTAYILSACGYPLLPTIDVVIDSMTLARFVIIGIWISFWIGTILGFLRSVVTDNNIFTFRWYFRWIATSILIRYFIEEHWTFAKQYFSDWFIVTYPH